jgi:sigma-B regulation protein RsbU (phosphoserine phosphatase)
MDPAKEVGGDFYDLFMIDEDHLAMVIADVSGKGIPAALFMMSSKILINDHAIMGGTPAEILERVNKQVFSTNKAHMFVTVWLGIFEISTGKLTSASAGHEYPMININGKYEILKDKHGLAIGAAGISKYKNTEITLKKGDSIFVYTDGVAEANNAAEELFGTDRTLEALNAIHEGASQKEVLAGVRAAVDTFVKEAPQFDDLTMLGMKYFGPENKTETEES